MAISLTARSSDKTKSWIALIALMIFLPLLIIGVTQITSLISRASEKNADIVIDTENIKDEVNLEFIKAFAQGGEESNDQLRPIINQIKTLKPKIIRIDHIYDHFNVVTKSNDKLIYNWENLDSALKTIIQTGATPMIVLSYMPISISSSSTLVSQPGNWNLWSEIVQKTIEHISGKSNLNLDNVYYEVWNEPDLEIFGKWGIKGSKNYLDLYKYSSDGASKSTNTNNFYLGGPATTTLKIDWITELSLRNYKLDFISWHTYYLEPKKISNDIVNYRKFIVENPKLTKLPIIISEFGITGSKDERYQNTYSATHLAAVTRELLDNPPKYLISFQLKDGPNQTNSIGGWGLLTHEDNQSQAKPRYHMFNWLDKMYGNRLALSGEGTSVTAFATIKDNKIKVLLINFNPDKIVSQAVPITLTNLSDGRYKIIETQFLGKSKTTTQTTSNRELKIYTFIPDKTTIYIEISKI